MLIYCDLWEKVSKLISKMYPIWRHKSKKNSWTESSAITKNLGLGCNFSAAFCWSFPYHASVLCEETPVVFKKWNFKHENQLYVDVNYMKYYHIKHICLLLLYEISIHHCLKKHRRLLHSKRNSILRDEATLNQIKLKCPALNCSRHFALYEIPLSTTGELSALQCGSFWKFWGYWSKKYPAALKDRQVTTQNQNKLQKS